jgi:hypothetical protein
MFDKIRKIQTAFSRTPTTIETYAPEALAKIGQTLKADRSRLEEIRQLPIDELDQLYHEATGQ